MHLTELGIKPFKLSIFFFIPAGHKFIQNIRDPNVEEEYFMLVLFSFVMSLAALLLVAIMIIFGNTFLVGVDAFLRDWFMWLIIALFWIGGWIEYFHLYKNYK